MKKFFIISCIFFTTICTVCRASDWYKCFEYILCRDHLNCHCSLYIDLASLEIDSPFLFGETEITIWLKEIHKYWDPYWQEYDDPENGKKVKKLVNHTTENKSKPYKKIYNMKKRKIITYRNDKNGNKITNEEDIVPDSLDERIWKWLKENCIEKNWQEMKNKYTAELKKQER